MNMKLKELLTKISFDEDKFNYFIDAKIDKILVHENSNVWNVYLSIKDSIPYEIVDLLNKKLSSYVENKYIYNIKFFSICQYIF